MKRLLAALIPYTVSLLALAAPAHAETCPVKHPALTALDRASMAAAYEASFVGAEGRTPTWTRGAGKDDGEYWIAVSNHFGEFGDGICRAGWSRYWELKLTTGVEALDPALGDQPARFQPQAAPIVTPLPPVPPAPSPQTPVMSPAAPADTAVLAAIADLKAAMQAEHAEQTRSISDALKHVSEWALKYLGPAVGAWIVGHQMAK